MLQNFYRQKASNHSKYGLQNKVVLNLEQDQNLKNDVILTKIQSGLAEVMSSFEGKNMQTKYV